MDQAQDTDITTSPKPYIIGYVKRQEDSNVILFADDKKRDELDVLFKDPFVGQKTFPFEGDTQVLADGGCYEVVLSQHGIEAMERQYVTSLAQADGLNDYEATPSEEGSQNNIRVVYQFDGQRILFKRIPPSRQLRDSKIISLDETARISSSTTVIAFDDQIDATYNVLSHAFRFTDFQAAKHVFGTLEVYYRSATQHDIDEWMDPELFDIDSQFDTFAISTPNRKKIAITVKELGIDITDPPTVERIRDYAGRNAPKMLFINNKFNIKKNSDVTEALRLITGSYYLNEITGDLMVVNAPKKADRSA